MKESITLRSRKVNNVAVLLEHVHLLDRLDRLHVHLLERRLELLVVGGGRLVDPLGLTAGSTLASVRLSANILPSIFKFECLQSQYAELKGINR